MLEERLNISGRTNNRFYMMIGLGLVLLILGIFLTNSGGAHHGGGEHETAPCNTFFTYKDIFQRSSGLT